MKEEKPAVVTPLHMNFHSIVPRNVVRLSTLIWSVSRENIVLLVSFKTTSGLNIVHLFRKLCLPSKLASIQLFTKALNLT